MINHLIHIDHTITESLQSQIRRNMVEGILIGSFLPGAKLPSSRKLAKQLSVSRNTIVLVYQNLIDEGYIVTKERSGIFVNDNINQGKVIAAKQISVDQNETSLDSSLPHQYKFKGAISTTPLSVNLANWRKYEYPFIDGKFDSSLYPIKEWRDANNRANATCEIYQWSELQCLQDDPMLLDEIRTKILPRRGIQASREEILITVGSQQALSLVTKVICR